MNGGGGAGGVCIPPTPVFGLFGSYPLSRGPREQPLPGPTCAPESSSSVMRLVLTPPFRRPPPPPPPPTTAATRRPRMACFFCRKRKIACGPGPAPPSRPGEGEKEDEKKEDDDAPCKWVQFLAFFDNIYILIYLCSLVSVPDVVSSATAPQSPRGGCVGARDGGKRGKNEVMMRARLGVAVALTSRSS